MEIKCNKCNGIISGYAHINEGIPTCQKCENQKRALEVIRLGLTQFSYLSSRVIDCIMKLPYLHSMESYAQNILDNIKTIHPFVFYRRYLQEIGRFDYFFQTFEDSESLIKDLKMRLIDDPIKSIPYLVVIEKKSYTVKLSSFGNIELVVEED